MKVVKLHVFMNIKPKSKAEIAQSKDVTTDLGEVRC
uniref:Uncharacterized protein n=1 Tax=Arundo donax TaxID=35708 RepID=A0A0A9A1I0_ARUDO